MAIIMKTIITTNSKTLITIILTPVITIITITIAISKCRRRIKTLLIVTTKEIIKNTMIITIKIII